MAYVQKTRDELMNSIAAKSRAAGRQSQTGMEIINNQKQLENNKQQQQREMNSYVNQFRGQMGLTNRATVKVQAQGGTGGSALYNQQQATTSLGQDLAQTQENYQQFTRDANEQGEQYDEALTAVGEAGRGDEAESSLSTELTENQKAANESAKKASAIATGVNAATTVLSTMLMFTGIGAGAGLALRGVGAAVSAGVSGWASAEAAKAGGADSDAQMKAGFLSAGINGLTSMWGAGGAGNAAGKTVMQGGKAIGKEIGDEAGKKVIADSTKMLGYAPKAIEQGTKEIFSPKTGKLLKVGSKKYNEELAKQQVVGTTKKATEEVVESNVTAASRRNAAAIGKKAQEKEAAILANKKTASEFASEEIFKNEQISKPFNVIAEKLDKANPGSGLKFRESAQKQVAEKVDTTTKLLKKEAIDKQLIEGTPEFNKFVEQGVQKNIPKLQKEVSLMIKADYEKMNGEVMKGIKNKLMGLGTGKGKVKFSRVDRLKTGEIGMAKFLTNTATRTGTAAAASYFGTQAVTAGTTKKSTNAKTKQRYGSIFDEIGRPDLRQKYGF